MRNPDNLKIDDRPNVYRLNPSGTVLCIGQDQLGGRITYPDPVHVGGRPHPDMGGSHYFWAGTHERALELAAEWDRENFERELDAALEGKPLHRLHARYLAYQIQARRGIRVSIRVDEVNRNLRVLEAK